MKAEPLHKLGAKVNKAARATCQRMGTQYRMPFAWAAKPIFRPNRQLDDSTEFGPVYRHDNSRISDEEVVKHLNELRGGCEKPKNVAVIPCRVSVTIKPLTDNEHLANVLSANLLPVEPFPMPPVGPVTLEVQQFYSSNPREAHPFTEFVNVLYVFPLQLKVSAFSFIFVLFLLRQLNSSSTRSHIKRRVSTLSYSRAQQVMSLLSLSCLSRSCFYSMMPKKCSKRATSQSRSNFATRMPKMLRRCGPFSAARCATTRNWSPASPRASCTTTRHPTSQVTVDASVKLNQLV